MKIPLDDTRERKIKLLTELNNRECIVRLDSNDILLPVFKANTLDYSGFPKIPDEEKIEYLETTKNTNTREKKNFTIEGNINLKDLLIKNSSSRKDVF